MSISSSTQSRKIILITGASSGIGEATARHLSAEGHTVVLGARRVDRIATLAAEIRAAGGDALDVALDVTDLASMQAFVDLALDRYGRVDVLINNAGVMPLSPLADLRIAEWNQMIDVNLRGVLHGIAAVLPSMHERDTGHIINVASVAAHAVYANAAIYCATKYAVRALSEGLRQESPTLRVTVISPGATRTAIVGHVDDTQLRADVQAMMDAASIPASAIAAAIGFAIGQPDNVDVNELIVRPTAQR
jgi:NADP-dependent 3-hydroxy acid dehydrogenase YdfG